ncbi:MAG: hypothetical protein JO361_07950 [Gammaproteobacteria bacterium]|nr:hypothetical protein [Gammaproteobacteria bacterium]
MSRRINIMVDDDTRRVLAKIAPGARSRTLNEALRSWAARQRRRDGMAELDALRGRLPHVSVEEVARWVREEREGH